ncbi:substrate-binding periplasmic protein [Shewanella gaetbuli]|uniref:Transporter substrate-binding domain-containing protein n=1 Tax=Shewanella gaetbuli TaxID=220752 RepID=A0A9X2CJN4_9GAMM|nr:transporter substrate-binding domain-containing protein [Shewanella gaetbuli]MCL1142201.1 transporter substrate-binding domain-containing protein [Shewanella gaetbuli]
MRAQWFSYPLLIIVITCLLVFTITTENKAFAQSVESKQVLRIASATERSPYIYQHDQSGLELDIIRAALADQGIEVEFQFSSRNRQVLHFERNKADAIMTINEYSGVSGYLSDSYISYHNMAITLAKNDIQFSNISDLQHYSVVAFLNAVKVLGEDFKKMAASNDAYLEVSPQEKQNKMLYMNRVQVVIADRYIFQDLNKLITRDVDVTERLHFHKLFNGPDYYLSFHDLALKNAFNAGLKNIRANGIYQQIEQQYLTDAYQ